MTPLADRLRELGPVDPPPTVEDLGGEKILHDQLPALDAELLPRAIEVVAGDVGAFEEPRTLGHLLCDRLPEVVPPISFANSLDRLLALTLAVGDRELARHLMDAVLQVAGEAGAGGERAMRASHAIRAAVDLALLDIGVSPYRVLSFVENIKEVPPEMASGLARAAGRLWERYDDDFLREVLEERVLPHEDGAGDATVELGLKQLRDAFSADSSEETRAALSRAIDQFERAAVHEENRPDARAYAAAARAVLAFEAQQEQELEAALDVLAEARLELDRYRAAPHDDFRGAEPLRSIAGWHVLAGTLRELRRYLDEPDVLALRPGIEALVRAYSGMRLGVLNDERVGLQAFIQPTIRRAVEDDTTLRRGLVEFAQQHDAPVSADDLAAEVVRPKAPEKPKPIRRRRDPRH